MSNLGPQQQNQSFDGLLQVPGGITRELQQVQDGNGNGTGLWLSYTGSNAVTADSFVVAENGTQITNAVPRLISDGFGDLVSVKDFGATGDGVTDDTAAIQKAFDYMTANTRSVYFPSGVYLISSTLNISGWFDFYGDAAGSSIKTTVNSIPLITVTVSSLVYSGGIRDMRFLGVVSSNPNHGAILFAGTSSSTVSHFTFSRLYSANLYYFVKDTIAPRTTSFGLEANINWCIWDDIQIVSVSQYGFWMTQGSGTGNTWDNIRCRSRNAGSAGFFFDGTGCVVGDIIISGYHPNCDDVGGSIGIEIGDDTVYRAQIAVGNVQWDANCNTPIKVGSGSVECENWTLLNHNIGGLANFGANLLPMSRTVINDRDVTHWQAGKQISPSTSGAISTDCFYVDLGSFGTADITVTVTGLIQGLTATTSKYNYQLTTNNVTLAALLIEYVHGSSSPNAFSVAVSSLTAYRAKVTVTCTAPLPNSNYTAVIEARGEKFKITRI